MAALKMTERRKKLRIAVMMLNNWSENCVFRSPPRRTGEIKFHDVYDPTPLFTNITVQAPHGPSPAHSIGEESTGRINRRKSSDPYSLLLHFPRTTSYKYLRSILTPTLHGSASMLVSF